MNAAMRLAQFASASGAGAFPNIDRTTFAADVAKRMADPDSINTAHVNLCGPAAFLNALARLQPDAYCNFLLDLWEKGRAKLGTVDVAPGSGCRNAKPPANKISAADWVGLASLRDSENSIIDYSSADDGAAGITMPHTMVKWLQGNGFTGVKNETNTFFTKGKGNVEAMIKLRDLGHMIFLFINAQMIQGDPKAKSMIPDHWVRLKDVTLRDDKVSVTVWSWGKDYFVPGVDRMDVGKFTNNLYGFVAGHPA